MEIMSYSGTIRAAIKKVCKLIDQVVKILFFISASFYKLMFVEPYICRNQTQHVTDTASKYRKQGEVVSMLYHGKLEVSNMLPIFSLVGYSVSWRSFLSSGLKTLIHHIGRGFCDHKHYVSYTRYLSQFIWTRPQ